MHVSSVRGEEKGGKQEGEEEAQKREGKHGKEGKKPTWAFETTAF